MGTLKSHLPEIMGRHRIKQTELAEAGELRYATVNDFYNGKSKRIDFATIAGVVQGLRRLSGHPYTVGDLFEYVEE
ncbi:helix-turn-helix domain-containing protein [Deinococcus fonticola]|uniref:helix-turn-helix domain-containing protein n=1 Tax=Deinococcus fonticola TaxID=2528713 RepID=UPI0010752B77|nr:helix-turn-helix transcriptional regulator [Deinococcus fonticola]